MQTLSLPVSTISKGISSLHRAFEEHVLYVRLLSLFTPSLQNRLKEFWTGARRIFINLYHIHVNDFENLIHFVPLALVLEVWTMVESLLALLSKGVRAGFRIFVNILGQHDSPL